MKSNELSRILAIAGLVVITATPQQGAENRHLTLNEAVQLALAQNHALKIARLKVIENEQKKAGQHSAYFPTIKNESNILHVTELEGIAIPAGAFGSAGEALVPGTTVNLPQGQTTLFSSGTQISQPPTQLIRIHDANRIA
jgi:hypothetical protein